MPSNEFHFVTHWRVQATVEEVSAILENSQDLVRWWPKVWTEAKELEQGDNNGVGKVIQVRARGRLPYTMGWKFRVIELRRPYGLTLEAKGDLTGRGIWTLKQDGEWADITYDWKVRGDKPLLRYLSFMLKPMFSSNHNWAMNEGEKALNQELARRRGSKPNGATA